VRFLVITNLRRYVFEPFDSFLRKKIKDDITAAVTRYEPRVNMTKLEITEDSRVGKEDRNVVFIRMYYQVKGDVLKEYVLDLIV
jgi:phage baseplate assembly protein W